MATEVKVPAILIPGVGTYLARASAIYDETLRKSQAEINNSIAQVEGLIDQINRLSGGTVQQATDINVTTIAGMTARSAQAALEELMSIKADKTNAVFYTTLSETVPLVKQIVADIANIAYTDAQGHDLVKLYNSVTELARDISRLKTRVDQDERNYLSKHLLSDEAVFYGNTEVARFSRDFTNFRNLKNNGKSVLVEDDEVEIIKRIQGKSENSSAIADPFKFMSKSDGTNFNSIEELLHELDGMYNNSTPDRFSGFYRVIVSTTPLSIAVYGIPNTAGECIQTVSGILKIDDGILSLSATSAGCFYRVRKSGKWDTWKPFVGSTINREVEVDGETLKL